MKKENKHILIDGTTLSKKTDGLSQYILSTVSCLKSDSTLRFTLIVRDESYCPADKAALFRRNGIEIETVKINPIGPLRDFQFGWYLLKKRKRFDWVFIPSNQFPIFLHIPSVYTIHDLIYEEYPEQLGRFSLLKRSYLRLVVKQGIKKAKHVIAVSNYTRSEIIRIHAPKNPEKIVVVYEGWEHLTCASTSDVPIKFPFEKYILYVGSTRKHKNLDNLLKAIRHISGKLPHEYGFIFVGDTSFLDKSQVKFIQAINENREIVHFTGWLSNDELREYFKRSAAFIFPSLSEGFGIPVLEAFYYKVPLLLSNRASLPEVGENAAIYFNPEDVCDIGEKILYFMANEEALTEQLVKLEIGRLDMFTWNSTAIKLYEFLQDN